MSLTACACCGLFLDSDDEPECYNNDTAYCEQCRLDKHGDDIYDEKIDDERETRL